ITETKSVKVDNWGVFFLQKLQNFFNKTDHCDLTLQFNDNSQLKVHRLVLSACTDYFNMLENTCEMYDDVLIMPLDLQADVIVPIVNFMYTGTLEFQYNMYEKLLKTARDMNMTVLLKLLEAHKQTTRMVQGGRQPIVLNKQAPNARPRSTAQSGVTYQMPASVARSYGSVKQTTQTRMAQRPMQGTKVNTALATIASGYTANKSMSEEETSPFEKLRKGYTNVSVTKRPAPASFSTPVAKKPNLEEVKEFTEAARLRSQIAAEDDDSPGFADDTHFDEEEEEAQQPQRPQQLPTKASPHTPKQIVIKQEQKSSPGSSATVKQITVKDESGNVDHAKIISEVLKKYPHLVKKNKNIKLKIMQKTSPAQSSSGQQGHHAGPMKMEVRTATPLKADISMVRKATEQVARAPAPVATSTPGPKKIDAKTMHALIAKGAENMTGPWLCLRCGIDGRPISIPSYKAFRNHLIVKHKEKIDARICEHCGWKAEQRNPNLFYHWLTEHNIKSTMKFPTCAECGHVAMNTAALQKHEEENHQRGDLQQCIYCNKVFAKEMDLYEHMKSLHKQRAREDGVIDFSDDEYHVQEDEEVSGTPNTSQEKQIKVLSNISITNNAGIPFVIDHRQAQTVSQIGGKPQIQLQQITLEPSSEAEALSNVASGIATSLGLVDSANVVIEDHHFQGQYIEHQMATVHGETGTTNTVTATGPDQLTKLITEDGTELQLTQSQKEEIFSQLQNSGNGGNVVMVLNDDNFIGGAGIQLEDGTHLISTAPSGAQDQNIVVMYTQAEQDQGTHSLITTTAPVTTTVVENAPSEQMEHHEEVQEATKSAAVTDHEDETSQASTQPSEKASEKDTEHMEVDPESSQHETDLSESADVDDSKHAEYEEEQKAAKEREKQKLISELEGDWSEDTEEQPTAAEQKEETKKSSPPPESTETSTKITGKEAASKKETVAESEAVTEKPSEKEINQLLDDWNSESKLTGAESDVDLEKKLEKVVGEKGAKDLKESEEETPMETSATEDKTADTAESSMNESETQVVILAAAESETDTSMKEDADKSQESQEEEYPASESEEKSKVESKKDATEEEQEESKEDEEDKTKSKEVVSSLLGDWDEDDDL
ncbi:AAEL002771-PA, partial [Aedes aegypti]